MYIFLSEMLKRGNNSDEVVVVAIDLKIFLAASFYISHDSEFVVTLPLCRCIFISLYMIQRMKGDFC